MEMEQDDPVGRCEEPEDVSIKLIFDAKALQRSEKPNSDRVPTQSPKNCGVIADLSRALASGKRSNLTLVVGNGQYQNERFPVHMDILALRCTVFEEKFQELPPHATELELPNVNPKVFKELLNYVYTEEIRKRMLGQELEELLDLACEYKLKGLIDICSNQLSRRIKVSSVVQLYRKALLYGLIKLEHTAFRYILKHGSAVLKTNEFENISLTTLCKILDSDELQCSEIDIFQATVKWGETLYNKRKNNPPMGAEALRAILYPAISRIRFPLMTAMDVGLFVAPTKLLTLEEFVALYNYVTVPNDKKPEMKLFNVKPRLLAYQEICQSGIQIGANADNVPVPLPEPVASTSTAAYVPSPDPLTFDSSASDVCSTSTIEAVAVNGESTPVKRKVTMVETNLPNPLEDVCRVQFKKNCVVESWDGYIRRWERTADHTRQSTSSITLENVTVNNYYPNVYMPGLKDIILNLKFPMEDGFGRFENVFDIRRFVFIVKDSRMWKLEELWDTKILISVKINGVKMLKMSRIDKELTISFRNDSIALMSGLRKSDHLKQLNLMKTDIPDFDGFPTRLLEQILFFKVGKGPTDAKISDFIRKCPNLSELSCWIHVDRKDNFAVIDLTKDLISGDKLTRLALCEMGLTFAPKTVKASLTELYLDNCALPANFSDNIHLLFPALRRLAIKMLHRNHRMLRNSGAQQPVIATVTARTLANIIRIESITWIRIWGIDWNERHKTDCSSPGKNLRNSLSSISEKEVIIAKSFLVSCGLREDSDNFILEKNPNGSSEWRGKELNENEPEELDDGFWDLMDKLEFEYFQLHRVYDHYQVFQKNGTINFA